MLKFNSIETDRDFNNNHMLLYEYFHHTSDKSDFTYKKIPLQRDGIVEFNIDDIFNKIYSTGDDLYNILIANKHYDFGFYSGVINKIPNKKEIEDYVSDWVNYNGYQYFNGFEYKDKEDTNELKDITRLFVDDTLNFYLLARTHELVFKVDTLQTRDFNYDYEYQDKLKELLEELNNYRSWFLEYGRSILTRIKQSCVLSNRKKWLEKKKLVFNKEKDIINLEFFIPTITLNKDGIYTLDISLLNQTIDQDNFNDVSKVIKGLSLLYVYKLKNYVYGQEIYYPIARSEAYYQNYMIEYEQLILDKDFERYKNYIMSYSLIGIAYYKLLLELTTDHEYTGSEMVKCANPNCKNYFPKKTDKRYCDSEACQKYRKSKKAKEYYNRKKNNTWLFFFTA